MRDVDIDELFERFKSGGPLMVPAGPDAARRISERRRRVRLSATAAAAVVLAAGASVVAYDLVPRSGTSDVASSPTPTAPTVTAPVTATPTSPPSPTSDGQPTDGPTTPTLQQSDVPERYRYEGDSIRGDWTLEFAASTCTPATGLGTIPSPTTQWEASFRNGLTTEAPAIYQRVVDYGSADAARSYMEAVRRMAHGCVQEVGEPRTWEILSQAFAGDDALVLRWAGPGRNTIYIVVRSAGLVTQIAYPESDLIDPVQVGQRAADRLCAATTAC